MLCSLCLILGVLGVVREPRLPSCVADRLHADVVLSVDDPLGNTVVRGSRDQAIGILQHHPLEEFVVHLALEGLVKANVDRLDKPCAAGRDELNLHAEGLDGVEDQPHLVDPKLVQEEDGDYPWWRRCNVGGKDMLDPIKYDLLIEPRIFIEAVDAACGEGGNLPADDCSIGHPCSENATINHNVRNSICIAKKECLTFEHDKRWELIAGRRDRDSKGHLPAVAACHVQVDHARPPPVDSILWIHCVVNGGLIHVDGKGGQLIPIVDDGNDCIKVPPGLVAHLRLIELKGHIGCFGGSKKSNHTDCTLRERSF
jgi:hypothetical protein